MESIEKADDDAALKSLIDPAACPKYCSAQLDQLFIASKVIRNMQSLHCRSKGDSCLFSHTTLTSTASAPQGNIVASAY